MKRLIILKVFLFSIIFVHAQSNRIIESEVIFTIKNTGINVNGYLSGLDADINFKPNDLKNSSIKASLDPATVNTGIGMRDKHLKKEDYFDVEKHKIILIESESFKKLKANEFEGVFDLTIKNITKEIVIPFMITKTDNGYTRYESHFEINRQDFNVGSNSIVLSDEVRVSVKIITE